MAESGYLMLIYGMRVRQSVWHDTLCIGNFLTKRNHIPDGVVFCPCVISKTSKFDRQNVYNIPRRVGYEPAESDQ